ncbi:neuroendocrine convertase 1-like [Orbicella faveolata]|uniref:neuroendocrine convertase 1-like n=1 Tax=Orbicella faveolata TaxID=48498 RepID=UPI0009E5BE4F|nr:neuroendocrine convertase 1-like [Orbicella faveolata]
MGARQGRHGKGSIFVFAAGNGGINGDSCAFNGYVNSIHTIAISGVDWDGLVPAYTEPCAAIMAVTYGQDVFAYKKTDPSLVTAKGAHDCTQWFPGSSTSTAFASGIIALTLQANFIIYNFVGGPFCKVLLSQVGVLNKDDNDDDNDDDYH